MPKKTIVRDRNAVNGRFEKKGYANKHKKTAIKDRMKK
jgi:hypothetical protein